MLYTKHLSEPWFSLIKLGHKKCEGRLHKGDFAIIKKGDKIQFENSDFNFKRAFTCKITSTRKYESFREYLESETLEKCLPTVDNLDDGVNIYYKYYKKEDEITHKIIALRLKVIK